MEKLKIWITDNILKEPLFWNALGLGLTTKVEELGIPQNTWWVQIVQLVLGASAASFIGAKFNRNTTITQATHDAAKSTQKMMPAITLNTTEGVNTPDSVKRVAIQEATNVILDEKAAARPGAQSGGQ